MGGDYKPIGDFLVGSVLLLDKLAGCVVMLFALVIALVLAVIGLGLYIWLR